MKIIQDKSISEKVKELRGIAKHEKYFRKFIQRFVQLFTPINYHGRYYLYKDGCYIPKETDALKSLIYKGLDKNNIGIVNSIEQNIKLMCLVEEEQIKGQKEMLNLQNGLLNLKTLELMPHSKNYISFNQLPFKYDPETKCPQFERFLNQIFSDEPEKADVLQEFCGYILEPDNRFEKALIGVGPGANGKGTSEKVLQNILGELNYSCVPLKRLGDRFETQILQHKMANFSSEVPKDVIVKDDYFKAIISGDKIRAEYKNGVIFFFTPRAKLFIMTNHLPRSVDSTYGFYRKIMILPFNISFKGDKNDVNLIKKLLTELPGIFNWMLKGRQRLIQRGHFCETKQMREALLQMRSENDSVLAFVENCCILEGGRKIQKGTLYDEYETFCRKHDIYKRQLMTKIIFGKALSDKFPTIKGDERCGSGRFWTGIGLDV